MKLRQLLRNSFQNAVEKHQEDLFQKQGENNPKNEAKENLPENENSDPLVNDFQALADFSAKLNKQIENNTDNITIIGDSANRDSANNDFLNLNNSSPLSASNFEVNGGVTSFTPTATQTSFFRSQTSFSRPASSTTSKNISPIFNNDDASDFEVDSQSTSEVTPISKKISKQRKGTYSYTPRKSKAGQDAEKKNYKKKKAPGSLKLGFEKKAQIVRQLATLLDAGMDLRSSLAILEEQEARNKNIWFFIHDLLTKIEAGDSFSDALTSSIVKFGESEIAMVRAGEAIGRQAETLVKMANLMEKKVRIKKKITSAMVYPATVLVVSSVVVLLLVAFVIPKFEKVINDQMGAKAMPMLTVIIIKTSRFVASHFIQIPIFIGIFFSLFLAIKTLPFVKKLFYKFLLTVPLVGNFMISWCMVLFSRTFGDLLVCGCSLVEALRMARESIGNYNMKENLSLTIEDVQQGMSLTDSIRRRSIFPAMAEGLVKVGEESGKLGEMMNKVAVSYEEELNEVIGRLTAMIEPVLVIFLAGFVGSVVIGLFLPLVALIQNIGT
ncbi:MAG: type II secretion system F family protein [Puniceicoccales bacterium]|jgi:type IV pilus assembly protein PilC|nr:type II secretion system F family protein [Puniceicoccales bacterium]